MVHASLRAVGARAEAVVAALDDVTMVMNLGAPDGPFDALRTPADPDVGVLAEVFRRSAGTVVNDHPDARFGARGPRAAALLAGPLPWDDFYGPGSHLERFVQMGGKVLRLGADEDTVTLLHLAEYLCDVPGKPRVTYEHPGLPPVSALDDDRGIVERDYFPEILRAYLATGRASVGRVGDAGAELLDARDLLAFATAWMTRELAPAPPR